MLGQQVQRPDRHLVGRVLEPLDRAGVERRRHRARGRGRRSRPTSPSRTARSGPAPDTDYVLAVNGVEVAGEEVARARRDGPALVRIGDELRLQANQIGVYSDGWMGASAAYNRFDVADDGDGFATVRLSRETFCPEGVELPGLVRVRIGTIGVGPDKQPAIDRETGSGDRVRPGVRCAGRRLPRARRAVADRGARRRRSCRQRSTERSLGSTRRSAPWSRSASRRAG